MNMVARGRSLINTQRELQDNIQTFYRGVAENKLRKSRSDEVEAMSMVLQGKTMPILDYQEDLQSDYVIKRRTLMLHIHRCLLSLKYRYPWKNISSFKLAASAKISDLNGAVRIVDGLRVNAAEETGSGQTISPFCIGTDQNGVHKIFPDQWHAALVAGNKLHFNIPMEFAPAKIYDDLKILDL